MLISTLISGWPFHPCYWGASIKNSSADFNYYRRTVDGRKDAAQHVDVSFFFSFLFFPIRMRVSAVRGGVTCHRRVRRIATSIVSIATRPAGVVLMEEN